MARRRKEDPPEENQDPAETAETTGKKPAARKKRAITKTVFPVIGLGASAGGLEAFGKFFSQMPDDTGMAFVLIQHLDPTHASNMVELLRRFTKMPCTCTWYG